MSVREESIPRGVQTNTLGLPWSVVTEPMNRNTPVHLVVNSREELVATFEDRREAEFCVQRVNGSR